MYKQIAFLVLFAAGMFYSYAQEPAKAKQEPSDTNQGKEIFIIVEVMPGYPGGDQARQQFLAKNIQYPESAKKNGIQGTVFSSFVVEKDGTLSDFKIDKGIGFGCDEEVLRVLKLMPHWMPGTQMGKPVRVLMRLPVTFSLK